ncbi:uncharacterized protein B0T15DRAFT_519826 [Chaetomium strumarium]|uniref:Uncharacterized protein n=1 Tax=Chaetomium strumarium TaxID=1170767 RepID=A0AAJ0H3J8_9PEZI|nr:hypothetical protein B0T15DRAFT_519826 [Chaetomium strumarium]
MLCGIHSHSGHHHHRFLRSSRSHKSNKKMLPQSHQPSRAGMPARPSLESSPRPSTASSRSDGSIDWDPLRLHPFSLAPGPAPPLPDASVDSTSRPYQPQELRQSRSSHNPRHQSPPSRHYASSSKTVIYGGFDFGFNNNNNNSLSQAMPSMTDESTTGGASRRAPSPTPSDASSECSLCPSDDIDEGISLGLGLAPPPAPRPRPRPRPDRGDGSSSSGLDDDAEDFLRRGRWKRRGIVFANTMPLAGEDETFEI